MADEHLRELQRAMAESDPEAAAHYLLQRVRAGNLTDDRLRLAAYLGDEGALMACEAPEAADVLSPETAFWAQTTRDNWRRPALTPYVLGFADWGPETCLRAALAVAKDLERDSPEGFLAVHQWLACPCLEHAEAATEAAERDRSSGNFDSRVRIKDLAKICKAHAGGLRAARLASYLINDVSQTEGEEVCLRALRTELTPWALGVGDPALDRLRAKLGDPGSALPPDH